MEWKIVAEEKHRSGARQFCDFSDCFRKDFCLDICCKWLIDKEICFARSFCNEIQVSQQQQLSSFFPGFE